MVPLEFIISFGDGFAKSHKRESRKLLKRRAKAWLLREHKPYIYQNKEVSLGTAVGLIFNSWLFSNQEGSFKHVIHQFKRNKNENNSFRNSAK